MSVSQRRPSPSRHEFVVSLTVFALLVAIGAVGRWAQPAWNFTPIAAVGLFAGAYFARRAVAVLVPLAAMVISNQWLPGYSNTPVMLTVYAMLAAPALAGPLLRRQRTDSKLTRSVRVAVAAVAPSAAFFLVTNLAEWWFSSVYQKTAAGLLECYAYALPFYHHMLAGDLIYVPLLFGSAALAGVQLRARSKVAVVAR